MCIVLGSPIKRKQIEDTIVEKNQAMQLLRIIWGIIEKLSTAEINDILRGSPDEDENLTTFGLAKMPKYSSRVLFVAAEMGNVEFIVELIRKYPERALERNDNKQSIFHVAVLYRQADVYTLLNEIGSIKESIINLEDIDGNNMLHLVGILEKTSMYKQFEDMSQVYVQIQEELIWFKKVKAILPPSLRVKKNKDGLSPYELFVKNHKDLVSNGQEWMKKTFSELLLLAALMITISFADVISFASGSNQDTPRSAHYRSIYNAFVMSNGFSFLFASISVIHILFIISSRYAEQDFLELLPKKLEKVTGALCYSMVFMTSAFSMIIVLLYIDDYPRVAYIIVAQVYMVMFLSLYHLCTRMSTRLASRFKTMSTKRIMY
ncbi:hypothetical protein OSB04_007129 [Centaurea solstitialis]|uniref:PGG domain-containing protein n=1 Tax=Centaurea solstitialis TaxID=347529 RepID=A0AA38TL27_9ASTR|nr:hypothetical protein OSB04_007129 [Centaurea solstitialis]